MRLSRTALLVLGIGIFIIAFSILFYMWNGQSREQEQLSESLAEAQILWPGLIAEKEDVADQLAQLESEVATAKVELSKSESRFPESVDCIDYDETLFRIVDSCGLQVVEITASSPAKEEVASEEVEDINITYAVTTLEVTVKNNESTPYLAGEFEVYIDETVDKVLDLIHLIATSEEFDISTIKLVSLNNLEPPEESEEVEEEREEKAPEATININIYGYPR
jgi:hypothetical protein